MALWLSGRGNKGSGGMQELGYRWSPYLGFHSASWVGSPGSQTSLTHNHTGASFLLYSLLLVVLLNHIFLLKTQTVEIKLKSLMADCLPSHHTSLGPVLSPETRSYQPSLYPSWPFSLPENRLLFGHQQLSNFWKGDHSLRIIFL